MSSKFLRYAIWAIIAIVLFAGIILLVPESIALYISAAIAILGLLKDSIDYYRLANGQNSLGQGYVEHLPLMAINAGFAGSMFFSTSETIWLAVMVGAIADSIIDFQQDFLLKR
jgi:hypothetical protein